MPDEQSGGDPIAHLMELNRRMGAFEGFIKESKDHRARQEKEARHTRTVVDEIKDRMEEVPSDVHRRHHELLDRQIEKERRRGEFYANIAEKLAANGIWAVVGGACYLAWWSFTHFIEKKIKGE